MENQTLICQDVEKAARLIQKSRYGIVFTGAGISVESGIPPFRGKGGLWAKENPVFLEIGFFNKKPLASWKKIKKFFYEAIEDAKPNPAHEMLAKMEQRGFVQSVITQNIDNLHQKAGNRYVCEIHGTSQNLVCTECSSEYDLGFTDLSFLPPICYVCKGILKPDMVFFNEPIPKRAMNLSFAEAERSDVCIIIGANGEVLPAADIPVRAKETGATIIEINVKPTHFTETITDVFLEGKAGEVMTKLGKKLYL